MALHNKLGKEAEEMAVSHLAGLGYEIIHCNWRHSHYEIDIIAIKNGLLRIIEVKSLKSSSFRHPEESVTKKKFKFLLKAADEYLFQNPKYRNVQFEILSIVAVPGKDPDFFLIEDVFL